MIQESSLDKADLSHAHARLIRMAMLLGGAQYAWPGDLLLTISADPSALEQLARLGLLQAQAEGFYRLLHEPSELLEQSEEEPQLERTLHSAALDWYGERLDGDPEREAAYDRDFRLSPLARGLDVARKGGVRLVSMKREFARVFPWS